MCSYLCAKNILTTSINLAAHSQPKSRPNFIWIIWISLTTLDFGGLLPWDARNSWPSGENDDTILTYDN